jgi:hypothetical protein
MDAFGQLVAWFTIFFGPKKMKAFGGYNKYWLQFLIFVIYGFKSL